MGIISVLMIAIGLAMDSLAVSISGGIVMQPFRMSQSLRLALTMGIFQGGMTLLGWLLGVSFSSYITAFDHWIAFILLGFLEMCIRDRNNIILPLFQIRIIQRYQSLNITFIPHLNTKYIPILLAI